MRITSGSVAAIAFSIAVCVSCSKKQEEAKAPPKPVGETVTAIGCPAAGPAPNCLTIKSKGKVYDLASISPPVDMSKGVGISFRGHAGTETTACGIKLIDGKFDYLGIQCAAPAPAAPAPPA